MGVLVTYLVVSSDVDRSRRFYTEVLGGETVLDGSDSSIVAIANGWITITVEGGPTPDKPTVTLEAPPDPDRISGLRTYASPTLERNMSAGEREGRTSSRRSLTGAAISGATCVTLTDTSSKSARSWPRPSRPGPANPRPATRQADQFLHYARRRKSNGTGATRHGRNVF